MMEVHDVDVAVIGSGPCGAVAAARLSSLGASVLVVDAGAGPVGGLVIKARGQTLFRRRSGGDLRTDRHIALGDELTQFTSSMSLGGLSNYWTSSVPRFAPDDFTDGSAVDERYVWPITYEDVAPHYVAVERMMRVTAGTPIAGLEPPEASFRAHVPQRWKDVAARCQEAGFGMGPMPMAKGSPWMIALRGSEFDSYHGILRAPERAGRLRIQRNTRVDTLRWSSSEGRVVAATCRKPTGDVMEIRARSFVVAAGAIDTTRILLASTSPDHPAGLGNSNDLLGRYLHDHLGEWWTFEASGGLPALGHPMYLARPSDSAPLTGFGSTIGLARSFDRLRALGGLSRTKFGVQVFGTMVPQPEHRVTLDAKDPLDGPIGLALDYDRAAREAVSRARPHLVNALRTAGVQATCSGKLHELMPGASVHYAGTVRMHASREWGVLDAWNRVYDAPNVVVCDASSFTTSPEKNPTPTAMALADRAASHLAGELAAHRV